MESLQQIDTASKGAANPTNPRELNEFAQKMMEMVLDLALFAESAAREGTAVHEVEKKAWEQLLALGREMLTLFFQSAGDGNQGEEMTLPDGRTVRRLEQLHTRPYQSIFGSFELSRVVYGTREGQKIKLVPLDQRLQLPEGKFSYVLQNWDQRLTVETPYAEVSATLQRILGFKQSVDSLERMNRRMAEPVVDYWDWLATPPASEEGEVLVLSADGKGVPIRRRASESPIETHQPTKGPKPGAKKMALVSGTYTVDRFVRTPQEVVDSLFRKPGISPSEPRPDPQNKRLRASLARSEQGTTEPAVEEIFGWMALEAEQRNPRGEKPLVLLMDGQTSLWEAAQIHLPDNAIEILDLLHVTPRLWKAAHLFHPKGSAGAAQFVRQRAERVLRGEVRSVITGLRRMATLSGLTGRKRKKLERICNYLENNQQRMKYHEYLAAGYPIATGVIEGACRHLVKDRLERTGMQWVLEGAQAMLDLRSIHLCGQWDDFQAFRIQKENQRLYPYAEPANDMENLAIAA